MDDNDLERLADRLAEKLEARRQCITPRLMDVAETARYLGRTVSAIQHMIKRGLLPGTRIDGKLQTDRVVIDQIIKATTT